MDKNSRETEERQGLVAATRRFPMQSLEIRRRVLRDENFRGICADLAAAESALASVDSFPAHLRDERRAEFEGMIESLALEIAQSLK
ncbi:MAG: hypothetical protein ACREEJ_08170 [Ensifer adhaerens]